ncbi:5-(carboxyamino)imidazole ribonucleotide synthase [Niveispirillum fermenti]|uniref:5-(carboxyamino)imidazole ribonucleotide synthase n=1 Tax=Niveispirillum fermenti TaxID=1233113 RepID=UPI003A85D479
MTAIPPGSVIGILGAGQLGRMTALAAANLGYRVHVFAPESMDSSCGQVVAYHTQAGWHDLRALARFADDVDVITLEWENVPTYAVEFLARHVHVHPGANVLAVAQDRLAEKSFANKLGIGTAPFRGVRNPAELALAMAEIGTAAILKSTRMGYDGKGQIRLNPGDELSGAFDAIGSDDAILEGFVDFELEISVVTARKADGTLASFPPVQNSHKAGILDTTRVPAAITPAVATEAVRIAETLATALQVVGLLAVEMFVTRDGRVLVNEMAPRPHNSGHWSIDFAETSQFEQLIRAICNLPLGSTGIMRPCVMTNLIGHDVDQWQALLGEPGSRLHLYGKGEARSGRKMGHVTRPV